MCLNELKNHLGNFLKWHIWDPTVRFRFSSLGKNLGICVFNKLPQDSEVNHILRKSKTVFLEKKMTTHSSVLAWRIPGTGEPSWQDGGLPSFGSHRVGHKWSNLAAAAARLSSSFPSLPPAFYDSLFATVWVTISRVPRGSLCGCTCYGASFPTSVLRKLMGCFYFKGLLQSIRLHRERKVSKK